MDLLPTGTRQKALALNLDKVFEVAALGQDAD